MSPSKEGIEYKDKNGKTRKASSLGVYKVENGKITRTWYYL